MNITIYGHPYSLDTMNFLSTNDITELYLKYKNDIVNHIDGAFSIVIETDDYLKVITDYYGYYPLFYNIKNHKVLDELHINTGDDYEIDKIYKHYMIEPNMHNINHSIIPDKDDLMLCSSALRTPFKNFKLISPRTIKTYNKNNKKIKNVRYNASSVCYSTNNPIEYYKTVLSTLINNTKFKKVVAPITGGYDCRNTYYFLTNPDINNVTKEYDMLFYTYEPEVRFVEINYYFSCLINSIGDIDYNNLCFLDYFKDKITLFNGMSNIYYYHSKLSIIDKFLDKDILFITSDGANEYLLGKNNDSLIYFNSLVENSSHSHVIKQYSKNSIYLPIFANKVLINSVDDRKTFMNKLSVNLDNEEQEYYPGKSNTQMFETIFIKNNKMNIDKMYYDRFIHSFFNN